MTQIFAFGCCAKKHRREKPMQKILYRLLFAIFLAINGVSGHADTETLQWYVDNDLYATTTCESGGDITLPTPPTKYGYTFQGWAGYTKIEYIESNGTQYIDTAVLGGNIGRVHMEFSALSADTTIMGAFSNTRLQCFIDSFWFVTFRTFVTNSTGDNIVKIQSNTKISIDWNIKDGSTTINNTSYSLNSGTYENINYTMYLFAGNNNGNLSTPSTMILYLCKIYDNNGVLVRDMIPVLDSNNIPCMYDLVEDKFYYNAGTGDFIAGPIVNEQ